MILRMFSVCELQMFTSDRFTQAAGVSSCITKDPIRFSGINYKVMEGEGSLLCFVIYEAYCSVNAWVQSAVCSWMSVLRDKNRRRFLHRPWSIAYLL